jgi:arylsulfatase A-like enzyme
MFATNTGVHVNELPLAEDAVTLAKLFNQAGYETGYIGKWHLSGGRIGHFDWKQEPVVPEKRGGYKHWMGVECTEFISDSYDTYLFDQDGNKKKLPGYRVDAYADEAIRFIDQFQHDQFFLFLSFLEPHHQNHHDNYPAPDGYAQQYKNCWVPPDLASLGGTSQAHLPGYYGMVKRLDEAFGRVLDALKSLDLMEDTIVLFLSDHGNHFKTRNDEYKRSCHDSSIRIPCAFGGSVFERGQRIKQVFSLVDIPPTLLDACNLDIPSTMEGRSAMSLLTHDEEDWKDEAFIQISESHIGRALRTRKWKYAIGNFELSPFENPKADSYKETYLYDLESDPYELTNLIGYTSHQQISEILRDKLLSWIEKVEGERPEIKSAPVVHNIGQRVVFPHELEM